MHHRFRASAGVFSGPLTRLLLCAILLCAVTPATAGGDAGPSPEIVRLLENILASQQGTATLQGRFSQRKTMALFKDPELSSGQFTFRQPDMMRLDYDTPSRMVLLLAGDELTTYYPDLKEAERFNVRKQKKRVFDHLIGESGISQLQKNFTIDLGSGDGAEASVAAPDISTHRLHLVPRRRQLKRSIEFIDLWVRTTDHAPVQYFIKGKSGDTTLFRLEAVLVNVELPESAFHIDLPDDVAISTRSGKDETKEDD